jgi:hypothetical protein
MTRYRSYRFDYLIRAWHLRFENDDGTTTCIFVEPDEMLKMMADLMTKVKFDEDMS